ncbi:MAG: hypothetical protein WCT18_03545 [Patescibacteria group bacterium]
MFNFLEQFHQSVRNTIIWFIVYFVLQAIVWLTMGILILIYPQTLFILVAIFFVIFAALNLYFMLIFIRYAIKLHRIKKFLRIK